MWRWINYCHRTWSWTWNAMFFFGVSNIIYWWLLLFSECEVPCAPDYVKTPFFVLKFKGLASLMVFIAIKCLFYKWFLFQILCLFFVSLTHCNFPDLSNLTIVGAQQSSRVASCNFLYYQFNLFLYPCIFQIPLFLNTGLRIKSRKVVRNYFI